MTLNVDGETVMACHGETVAAAMLAAGHFVFRQTPVTAGGRGPFCMMGACFDCLVEIDGEPNRQACMTLVADGMEVRPMLGARPLDKVAADD
ncbi:MAG: (2Fe-2S)-binding protein [Geminicoccaceae bacterium]